jgi:peptide/nickel transport system permease protein
VVLVLVAAVAAPVLSPHDPTKQNLKSRMLPPAWHEEGNITYPLGTDQLGRDLLSRLIHGARVSVIVGVLGVIVSAVVGVALGLLSGFVGGWLDVVISRTVDTFMAIPFILLALAVVGALGLGQGAGIVTLVVVLGLTGWVTFTRVIRGEVLSIREREYVLSTRSIGQRPMMILFRHILPNVTASIIVLSTLQISTVILAELPGPGHPTANYQLGRHARRRARPFGDFLVAGHVSRPCHQPDRTGHNLAWRLAARCVGSENEKVDTLLPSSPAAVYVTKD